MMVLKCFNCGREFIPTEFNPAGIPSGISLHMQSGNVYHVCSICIMQDYEKATKKIQEAEGTKCTQ
jgi:hypothetical protein